MSEKRGMAARGSGKGGLGRGIGSLFPTNYIKKDKVQELKAEDSAAFTETGEKPKSGDDLEEKSISNAENTDKAEEKPNTEEESVEKEKPEMTEQSWTNRSADGEKQTKKESLPETENSSEDVNQPENEMLKSVSQEEGSDVQEVKAEVKPHQGKDALQKAAALSQNESVVSNVSSLTGGTSSLEESVDLSDRNGPKDETENNVVMLKIRQIESNKNQPRRKFDEDSLTELSDSIEKYGVLQPVLVQKKGEYYELIAGERRWRAARMAGLKEIPAIVREYSPRERAQVSLIENLQREDLNPIEEAQAYRTLIESYHLTQDAIAEELSKSRTAITNALRLLKLNDEVQKMLAEGLITEGHAKVLLSLSDEEGQLELANRIMDEGLSVRETEKIVRALQNKKAPKEEKELSNQSLYHEYEEKLRNRIGTKVRIQRKAEDKGRIEIDYYSDMDLQKILDLIGI